MVRVKLVVSRFNENIDWTKQFSDVIIYNKGNDDIDQYYPIKLPNVGREGHTFYKYIYDNYENLSDYTAFLQGNPFDHSPNVIERLQEVIAGTNQNTFDFFDFLFLSERILDTNLSDCPHHPRLPMRKVYDSLLQDGEKKDNLKITFGAGGQFVVSKRKILERPRDFYMKVVKLLDYSIDPIEGYVVERFHGLIFQTNVPFVARQLLLELWCNIDPYQFSNEQHRDTGYPHTNITTCFLRAILTTCAPRFWLEIGSMIGGSAIKTADCIKALGKNTEICCIDPFCGDVNMWAWEKGSVQSSTWRFLNLSKGRPTIYDRFLANIKAAGHDDIITPIVCTSSVGIKLLRRLFQEKRLSRLPDGIYLDSAHEPDETYLELCWAWSLLESGGVLMGDDWDWESVRNDILKFSINANVDKKLMDDIAGKLDGSTYGGDLCNVLLYKGQWLLVKGGC